MNRSVNRREVLKAAATSGVGLALGGCSLSRWRSNTGDGGFADTILFNGKITTLDDAQREVSALAILGGRFAAVGTDAEVLRCKGPNTRVIDLGGGEPFPASTIPICTSFAAD